MEGIIYILQNAKGRRYLGSCVKIDRRLEEHNSNQVAFARNRGPWEIVFLKRYSTIKQARQVEYRLKKLKRKDIIDRILIDKDILMGQ